MCLQALHVDGEALMCQAPLQRCLSIGVAHEGVQQSPLHTRICCLNITMSVNQQYEAPGVELEHEVWLHADVPCYCCNTSIRAPRSRALRAPLLAFVRVVHIPLLGCCLYARVFPSVSQQQLGIHLPASHVYNTGHDAGYMRMHVR